MGILLLIIIYLAFISLGLPDSLLGAAWPVMRTSFGAPLETAGVLFMMIAMGTIVSSLLSGWFLEKFGTARVTIVSVALTALALFGFSLAHSLVWLVILTMPLGIGAGAVDSGLNHFVAARYKAHHMNWLHCFWGLGAMLGPMILAHFIKEENSWREGYLTIAVLQGVLVFVLLLSIPLWPGRQGAAIPEEYSGNKTQKQGLWKIKGLKPTLLTFLLYCGIEAAVGLWGSSYLVEIKGVSAVTAARWVSFYYGGITAGRFITGFIAFKVKSGWLIRGGQMTALIGVLLLLVPEFPALSMAALIIIGLGFAPIFPSLMHVTPSRFGQEEAGTLIGWQMAVAYVGSTCLPPLLGLAASQTTILVMPFFILLSLIVMLFSSELVNQSLRQKKEVMK